MAIHLVGTIGQLNLDRFFARSLFANAARLLIPLVPDRTNPASNSHLHFLPIAALSQAHHRNLSPRPCASCGAVESRPKEFTEWRRILGEATRPSQFTCE